VGADLLSVLDTGGTGEARRPSMMSAQLENLSLADLLGRDGAILWFTRHGWVNPLGQQRSELQRVLYRLDNNGSLFRDYWPERNQQMSSMPQASLLLLENVQAISISFLPYGQTPDDSAWLPYWPLPSAQLSAVGQGGGQGTNQALNRFMPAAIRVLIQTPELGQVERIFLLAGV
jgi:general secretion pathway protein J